MKKTRIMIAATLLALTLSPATAFAGVDAATTPTVTKVVITSGDATETATLTLNFTKAITATAADKVRDSLGTVMRPAYGAPLRCWGSLSVPDSNGRFTIQYNCNSSSTPGAGTLPWGYKISSSVQAIIVSPVSETGLRWWRNGYLGGQNAPHTVPKNYQFHGTMNPVWTTDSVSYQDYMTFRHNIGPGGTASITFAGGVKLQP